MAINLEQKNRLISYCQQLINSKVDELYKQLIQLNDAISNETKSSAGDKFETAREMMNQEKSKISDQLLQQELFKTQLNAIREEPLSAIEFGSLVETDKGNFLVAAALGKLEIDNIEFFAISVEAPFFRAMQSKQLGDEFKFRNNIYIVKALI